MVVRGSKKHGENHLLRVTCSVVREQAEQSTIQIVEIEKGLGGRNFIFGKLSFARQPTNGIIPIEEWLQFNTLTHTMIVLLSIDFKGRTGSVIHQFDYD